MTKKSIKKETNSIEVIANCDHNDVGICSSEKPQYEVQNLYLNQNSIENLIYTIRGQKVMIDFDLAMLYGVTTSRLNEQVKRNIERFPDDFMFQLTKEEWKVLRTQCATTEGLKTRNVTSIITGNQKESVLISQNATSKPIERRGGTQKPPHAFTRNGIGMLSSVLRSNTAVGVNIRIMRAFTAIPEIVNNNAVMMQRILNIEQHQTETDEKVNHILTTIEERNPKQLPEQIFATGCVWDAWSYVSELVRSATQRIVLIDNFVDDRVLTLLDKRDDEVEATIHTRYNESFLIDLRKHNDQYSEIKYVQLPHKNHDRFLIIDDGVYFLGASVKDMGVGMCAVTKMQTSPNIILQLLK